MKKIQFMLALMIGLMSLNNSYAQSTPIESKAATEMKAQDRQERGQKKRAAREDLRAKLALSADQEIAFDAISLRYKEQMQNIREANKGDKQAVKQEMRNLRELKKRDLQQVLTPEQFAILEAESKQGRNQRSKRQNRSRRKG